MELLQDKYFSEEPLPVPISEYNEVDSDSALEEFGTLNITTTGSDLSIQIP